MSLRSQRGCAYPSVVRSRIGFGNPGALATRAMKFLVEQLNIVAMSSLLSSECSDIRKAMVRASWTTSTASAEPSSDESAVVGSGCFAVIEAPRVAVNNPIMGYSVLGCSVPACRVRSTPGRRNACGNCWSGLGAPLT